MYFLRRLLSGNIASKDNSGEIKTPLDMSLFIFLSSVCFPAFYFFLQFPMSFVRKFRIWSDIMITLRNSFIHVYGAMS